MHRKWTYDEALAVDRNWPGHSHIEVEGMRSIGWLWWSPSSGRAAFRFTTSVQHRSYPPDAEFKRVYVLEADSV